MAHFVPKFLGSQSTSQFLGRKSLRDCLMEVQEDNPGENEVEQEAPLSPSRSQAPAYSVRRTPMDPKGPESISSRVPKKPLALMQDSFALFWP